MSLHINQFQRMLSPPITYHPHSRTLSGSCCLYILEVIEMKLSNRAYPLTVVIAISVFAAIAIASPLLFPSAKATPQSGHALTGKHSVPALDHKSISRTEDKKGSIDGHKATRI